jgi:hypothetical protein
MRKCPVRESSSEVKLGPNPEFHQSFRSLTDDSVVRRAPKEPHDFRFRPITRKCISCIEDRHAGRYVANFRPDGKDPGFLRNLNSSLPLDARKFISGNRVVAVPPPYRWVRLLWDFIPVCIKRIPPRTAKNAVPGQPRFIPCGIHAVFGSILSNPAVHY